jgi:hypothetical protein
MNLVLMFDIVRTLGPVRFKSIWEQRVKNEVVGGGGSLAKSDDLKIPVRGSSALSGQRFCTKNARSRRS